MTLWSSAEAESATLGKASERFAVNGLSIDTRTLKEGDLFVALKTDNRDGHDFVRAAFAARAGAALVSRKPDSGSNAEMGGPLLTVADTQRGLEDLARAARARSNARILGVTAPCPERAGPHPCLRRVPQQSLGCAAFAGRAAARC